MVGSSDAIRELVEPALASSEFELWDVEVSRDVVRVLLDRPGGVDLDALAAVAGRVVSPLLDEHPEITPEGHFQLEVSSPGVERNLRTVEQYRRYIGSEVSVKTKVPVEGARRHYGTLLAVDDEGIRIEPKDGPEGTSVELAYSRIERARTVLVWGPAGQKNPSSAKNPKSEKPKSEKLKSRAAKRPVAPTAVPPVASIESKDVPL